MGCRQMTDKEFELAAFLFRNLGRLLSRGHLLEAVWGRNPDLATRTVDTHISRVRSKLNLRPENGFRLTPTYNFGYRLERIDRPTAFFRHGSAFAGLIPMFSGFPSGKPVFRALLPARHGFPQQLHVFRFGRASSTGAGWSLSLFIALMATKMAIATIMKSMMELTNTPYLNSGHRPFRRLPWFPRSCHPG